MAPLAVVLASAGYDHAIRLWEAPTGVCYRSIQYLDSQVNRLAITPDKQFLAVAGNPHVRLYEINSKNPNPVMSFDGHTTNVTALGFDREGKWMYTGSEDGTVKIWDLRAPGCQREYESRAAVNTVELHPNQGELVSGDQNGNIRVWDLTANCCSRELVPDGDNAIRSISIASNASMLVAGTNSGTCFVWKLAASATDNSTTFEPLHRLPAHDQYCLKALISPDTNTLATTSADGTVKLWNVKNNFALDKTLTGHTKWVWDAVFSADAAYLVTASSDASAKLWDLNTGECIRDYTGHSKAVVAVALNDSAPDDLA